MNYNEIEQWIRPLKGGFRYDQPACGFAEHRLLALLQLLEEYFKRFDELPAGIVVPTTLYSYDGSQQIIGNALVKQKITIGPTTYHLGENICLMLDTNLAGIIAQKWAAPRFKNTMPTQALRTLSTTSILNELRLEQETTLPHSIFKTPEQIKLLRLVQELINLRGFAPVIIDLITKLKLPFNKETFEENIYS